MGTWARTINIKPFLHEDQTNESPEHVTKVAKSIAGLLRAMAKDHLEGDNYSTTLTEVVETFEDFDQVIKGQEDEACDIFNETLSELYDWADRERIWLGL